MEVVERQLATWIAHTKLKNYQSHRNFKTYTASCGLLISSTHNKTRYPRTFYTHKLAGILSSNDYLKPYYFYKISSSFSDDSYIGHTYCIDCRMDAHMIDSQDPLCSSRKLYNFINSNGGWKHFNIAVLKTALCSSRRQAETIEQFLIDAHHPTLNSIRAVKPRKKPRYDPALILCI